MRASSLWTLSVVVAVFLLAALVWAGEAPKGKAAGDVAKGKAKYQELCAACHGASGKGDGPAAAALQTKPRNHTDAAYMNKLKDQQIFDIIKKGGQGVGKSPLMPAWAGQLTDAQIRDVVAYIRTLARKS